MIHRFVKLTFQKEHIEIFVTRFDNIKVEIRNQEGCQYLQLFQDKKDSRIFFTHSIWLDEAHLNAYRKSEFFGVYWPEVKTLFAKPPLAWSLDQRDELP